MGTSEIKVFVSQKIKRLNSLPDNQRRAELARLRRGVGRAPGELPELWGAFLMELPDELRGHNEASRAEWAIYIALTLYALHQQGKETSMNCVGKGLGTAVRELAEQLTSGSQDWTESSVLRRFNALATATQISEISNHLRGMIKLLRSAPNGAIPLDYAQLAVDLYNLQCDNALYENVSANVKLRWGQDLYHNIYKEKSKTEE